MLASSGLLSLAGSTAGRSVSLELGRTATATTSLGETSVRSLANKASGAVAMSDLYGKALYPAAGTLLDTYCTGYSLYGNYANGSGGSYAQLIESNSVSCGYVGGGSDGGGSDGSHDTSDINDSWDTDTDTDSDSDSGSDSDSDSDSDGGGDSG